MGVHQNQNWDNCIGIGFDFRSHSSFPFDRYSLVPDQIERAYQLGRLRNLPFWILSTCNRVEWYCAIDQMDDVIAIWESIIGFQIPFSKAHIYRGDSLLRHLISMGSGLESKILGDQEIFGQLKKSFQTSPLANEKQWIQLSHQWIPIIKKILRTTNLQQGSTSLGHYVVKYIQKNSRLDSPILVLGAGQLASGIVKRLHKFGFQQVVIQNRTLSNSLWLTKSTGYESKPWTDSIRAFPYQFVVAATHGHCRVEESGNLRHTCLIDLGMPPVLSCSPTLNYLGLTYFQKQINYQSSIRSAEVEKAQKIISQSFPESMRRVITLTN